MSRLTLSQAWADLTSADNETKWKVNKYTALSRDLLPLLPPPPFDPSFPSTLLQYLTRKTAGGSTWVVVLGEDAEYGVRLSQR